MYWVLIGFVLVAIWAVLNMLHFVTTPAATRKENNDKMLDVPVSSVLSWEDLLTLSIHEAKFVKKWDVSIVYGEQILQHDLEHKPFYNENVNKSFYIEKDNEGKKNEEKDKMNVNYLEIQQRNLLKLPKIFLSMKAMGKAKLSERLMLHSPVRKTKKRKNSIAKISQSA